jgi:hypothetical protein
MLASEGHPISLVYIKSERAVAMSPEKYQPPPFRLTVNGICSCGGKLVASEWETTTHRKGRTTCSACGRTELKLEKKDD